MKMGTAPRLPESGNDWFDAVHPHTSGESSLDSPALDEQTESAEGQFPQFDDYFDLPLAEPAPQRAGWARRHRTALVVGGTVTCLVMVGSIAATALMPAASTAGPAAEPTPLAAGPAPTATHPAPPQPWCSGWAPGTPVNPHSTDQGEAAIAGFEDALYGARDGVKARTFVVDGAPIASAGDLTNTYAALPPGTEHCVLAQPTGNGAYAVDLFTRTPGDGGGGGKHYTQTVTTTTTPQGVKITAISPRGEQK